MSMFYETRYITKIGKINKKISFLHSLINFLSKASEIKAVREIISFRPAISSRFFVLVSGRASTFRSFRENPLRAKTSFETPADSR